MIARELGHGRPLVLVHGFGVDHRDLLPLESALDGLGWRRIYLDLPWAGLQAGGPQTAGTATTAQEVADGVVNEIKRHLGDEPFALLGNSFGGMMARYAAHTLKDQMLGLATMVSVFPAEQEDRILPPRHVIERDPAFSAPGVDEATAEFLDIAVLQTADVFEGFSTYALPGLQSADQALMDKISASYALDAEPEAAHPEPFDLPSLHIFGRQDHVTGYEDGWARRDHYPRGTFTVLDAAGHNLHLERPSLVSALIRDWLQRMEAAPEPSAPDSGA